MKARGIRAQGKTVHLAAFLLPVLVLLAGYMAVGLYPFGPLSSLALDMRSQYISFFSYLRDEVWLGGADYLYTFSKALGGDMAGFAAYYLMSPLNAILLLFPTGLLPVAVTVITLCKVGLCGLSMSLLLNRRGVQLGSLLFSFAYALMDYVVAFQLNVMWLDGVIMLPLIVLGIERLLEGKSPAVYVASLAAALVLNYYIGYMLCLFAALWFCVSALCFHPKPARGWGQRGALRPVWRFGAASLLGGGLSAVVVLPALFSLQGGKAAVPPTGFWDKSWASLADVVSRYLPGTASSQQVFFGYPHIYCGMLALVCAVLFFVGRRTPRRHKLGGALLLGVLVLSFCVGPLDRLWHGLNKPVGFLYRYSFLFSFVLLVLGWRAFCQLRARTVRRMMPMVVVCFALVLWLAAREGHTHVTPAKLALGLGLACAAGAALWLHAQNKYRVLPLAMMVLVMADLGASMFLSLRRVEYYPMADYQSYVQTEKPVIDSIKAADDGFYRVEKTHAFSDNDAMLLGYRGLSHFSSADKLAVRQFLDGMGLSDGGYSVKYAGGSTAAVDSLLAVKYLVAAGNMPKTYQYLYQQNGRAVWQNPTALPVGFLAGAATAQPPPKGANLFATHNAVWRAMDPALAEDLYRPAAAEITLHNVNQRALEDETLYERTAEEGWVAYAITVTSTDTLYAHFATQNYRDADLYVNDEYLGVLMTNDNHGVVPLGSFAPGQQVTVRLAPRGWELFVQDAVFVYENAALLAESCARLAGGGYQLDRFTSSRFSGTVTVAPGGQAPQPKELLLLSIPYDEGWQATVDGQPVRLQPALGTLMALPMPTAPGTYAVTLHYIPPGLWLGLGISLAAALGLAVWWWARRRAGATAAVPQAGNPKAAKANAVAPARCQQGGHPQNTQEQDPVYADKSPENHH